MDGTAGTIRVTNMAGVDVSLHWINSTGHTASSGHLVAGRGELTLTAPPPGGWYVRNADTGDVYGLTVDGGAMNGGEMNGGEMNGGEMNGGVQSCPAVPLNNTSSMTLSLNNGKLRI